MDISQFLSILFPLFALTAGSMIILVPMAFAERVSRTHGRVRHGR
jgi:hypothetical protein